MIYFGKPYSSAFEEVRGEIFLKRVRGRDASEHGVQSRQIDELMELMLGLQPFWIAGSAPALPRGGWK